MNNYMLPDAEGDLSMLLVASPIAVDILMMGGLMMMVIHLKVSFRSTPLFERGLSVIVISSLDGVCCGSFGTLRAKMCFRESSDAMSCPVSHTRNKAIADLSESTLYRVDGGASSTTLLLDACLLTTGIGESDLRVIMTIPITEEEWANEVLTF